jgi:hypothetical protein
MKDRLDQDGARWQVPSTQVHHVGGERRGLVVDRSARHFGEDLCDVVPADRSRSGESVAFRAVWFGFFEDERGHIRDIANIDPVYLRAARREKDPIVFEDVRAVRVLEILSKKPGLRLV